MLLLLLLLLLPLQTYVLALLLPLLILHLLLLLLLLPLLPLPLPLLPLPPLLPQPLLHYFFCFHQRPFSTTLTIPVLVPSGAPAARMRFSSAVHLWPCSTEPSRPNAR